MKKAFLSLGIVCMGLLVFSCGTTKKAMSPAELDGQWNIVEVNGKAIEKGEMPAPFIGFDFAQKRIFGNSGCNRMMGQIEYSDSHKNIIKFPQVATTRMACPDMSGERELLQALDKVVRFEAEGDTKPVDKIAFYGTDNTKLMVIEKK